MLTDAQRATLLAYVDTVRTVPTSDSQHTAVQQALDGRPEEDQLAFGQLLDALAVFDFAGSSARSRAQILRTVGWASSAAREGFVALRDFVQQVLQLSASTEEMAKR